jgi:hypothetical protein
MKNVTTRLTERVRISRVRLRERRDHDRAMSDPRIRDEHYAARAREVASGSPDCHFCV